MSNLKILLDNPNTLKRKSSWLIEGLIKPNTLNLISGDPACGKSTLIMNAIKSLADGSDFLGRKTKKVNKVLYVSTEMNEDDVCARFKELKVQHPEKIEIICNEKFGTFNLDDKVADIDVVIIDLVFEFLDAGCDDINDYKKVLEFFQEIRRSYRLNKCTWIFVHHLNKRGCSLGSVAIEGIQDSRFVIRMPNKRTSPLRVLEIYGKQVKCAELNYLFDYPFIKLCLIENDDSEEKIDYELSYIIEQTILKGLIEGSATKISSELGLSKYGRNPRTLTKYLIKHKEILNENKIELDTDRNHDGRLVKLIYNKDK